MHLSESVREPRRFACAAFNMSIHHSEQPTLELIESLRSLAQFDTRMKLTEAAHGPLQSIGTSSDLPLQRCNHSTCVLREAACPLTTIRRHRFRCTRRRRRAHVRNEISDREVHLVADAAHNWNRAGVNGARDDFFMEGPQVFERSAAASQDENVALGSSRCEANCPRDLRRRRRALHGNGVDQHGNRAEAPLQYMQDVTNRGSGR